MLRLIPFWSWSVNIKVAYNNVTSFNTNGGTNLFANELIAVQEAASESDLIDPNWAIIYCVSNTAKVAHFPQQLVFDQ